MEEPKKVSSLAKEAYDWVFSLANDAERAEKAIEVGYMECQKKYGHETEYAQALSLERHGGICIYCKKPFMRKTCGAFYWYEPACHCYQKCTHIHVEWEERGYTLKRKVQGCGRYMVYEKFKGLNYCTVCRIGKPKEDKPTKTKFTKKKEDT